MKKAYVILLENTAKALNQDVVKRHVNHLERLDAENKLVICGPFKDYAGGMIVLNCSSLDEAHTIANKDPFVSEGYRTYTIRTLEVADQSNRFLL